MERFLMIIDSSYQYKKRRYKQIKQIREKIREGLYYLKRIEDFKITLYIIENVI